MDPSQAFFRTDMWERLQELGAVDRKCETNEKRSVEMQNHIEFIKYGGFIHRWSHHRLFSSSKTADFGGSSFKWVVQPPSQSLSKIDFVWLWAPGKQGPKINKLETGEMHLLWLSTYLLPVVPP